MASVDPKDLLKAGAHFGHKTSRWHPKMAPYIHGVRGDVDVKDLIQNGKTLDKALEEAGLMSKIEDYVNKVGCSERTDAVIEPKLSVQWFVNMTDIAKPALEVVEKAASSGKQVLLVGTKRQAQDPIRKIAKEHNQPYVVERWLGGMMTNWNTMSGRIKKLKTLVEQMLNGELA